MFFLSIVSQLFVFVTVFVIYTESRDYAVPERRVIGGSPANFADFPFFAWITVNGDLLCGATLISRQTALTSAHCFDDIDTKHTNKTVEVCAGTVDLEDVSKRVCRRLKFLIRHPFYNNFTLDNDIAIIQIQQPFPITPTIRPILVKTEHTNGVKTCVTLGYGLTKDVGDISSRLMYVKVPIVPSLICALEYLLHNIKISSTMLCAGYFFGGKDACYGDSGGPLICDNKLTGIVSFGLSCAKWMRPGVYTNVSRFISWIERNTGLHLKDFNNEPLNNNSSFWNSGKRLHGRNFWFIILVYIFLYLLLS